MYKEHPQVYTSTFTQLASGIRRLGRKSITLSVVETEVGATLAFGDVTERDVVCRALGISWNLATEQRITEEGNYMCVLRNNHVLHVQGVDTGDGVELLSPMYPPLPHLLPSQLLPVPPVDETVWFVANSDGSGAKRLEDQENMHERSNIHVFPVAYVAGPHIHCRMPVIGTPPTSWKTDPQGWRALTDRLVNQLAAEDNQVVWWRTISAPPHYTNAMVTAK